MMKITVALWYSPKYCPGLSGVEDVGGASTGHDGDSAVPAQVLMQVPVVPSLAGALADLHAPVTT